MAVKRILIFSTAYLPLIGGAELAVKEITDRITDARFVMITARIKKELPAYERIGNIEVHRVGVGNPFDKYLLVFAGQHIAEKFGHFDAVWAIMASYAGFAALKYKKRHKDSRFLLTLQEGDSKWDIYKHVWWCWPWFKQIFKRADCVQAISRHLASWAKDIGAICPIKVVPNGVDLERFVVNKNQESSRELNKIITVSRLVRKNGIDTLISSLVYLQKNISIAIAGSGKLERQLKILAKRIGVDKRVNFLGHIDPNAVPNLLAKADVFCRPSRSEGMGNAFLEAMAAGVPVVSTSVGGIPDIVKDGETGLMARVNDPKDLAEKITRVLADRDLRERLVIGGRITASKYSWNFIAEDIRMIFYNIL